jgi:hypothetical protein
VQHVSQKWSEEHVPPVSGNAHSGPATHICNASKRALPDKKRSSVSVSMKGGSHESCGQVAVKTLIVDVRTAAHSRKNVREVSSGKGAPNSFIHLAFVRIKDAPRIRL